MAVHIKSVSKPGKYSCVLTYYSVQIMSAMKNNRYENKKISIYKFIRKKKKILTLISNVPHLVGSVKKAKDSYHTRTPGPCLFGIV